jgi:phosphohistidine phosphatase SixA
MIPKVSKPQGIRVVLIRHGDRERRLPRHEDHKEPLTHAAECKAHQLGEVFLDLAIAPELILTSSHKHALQTAKALAAAAAKVGQGRVEDVNSLTPPRKKSRWQSWKTLWKYWRKSSRENWKESGWKIWRLCTGRSKGAGPQPHWADELLYQDLSGVFNAGAKTVFIVGHEPRLSQLLVRFTGKRQRQLEALEAVAISAKDFESLWLGCGTIDWRYPVRNWLETELSAKLTSKMTVATFLASANFVALVELLINKQDELRGGGACKPPADVIIAAEAWSRHFCKISPYFTPIGFLLLTLAAGLFIATVYLYDRLGMPSGFWLLKRPWWIKIDDEEAIEPLLLHGYPQAHMIRIWRLFFTPAVFCSFAGVTLLVMNTSSIPFVAGYLALSLFAFVVFWRARPTGDVD